MVDFAELKSRISIEQVLDMLGIEMKKAGEQLRGTCPLTDGSNERSFVVTPSKGLWYSFAAAEGGDAIQLVARVRNLNSKDAAQAIADHFDAPSKLKPIDYLVPDHESVLALGLTKETCVHFGAGWKPKGLLSGRLAIPIHDADGALLAYCGRAVKKGQERFAYPKGYSGGIFNAHRLKAGTVSVTDDPLKVMMAFQHDVQALALLGDITPDLLDTLAALLRKKSIERVELL